MEIAGVLPGTDAVPMDVIRSMLLKLAATTRSCQSLKRYVLILCAASDVRGEHIFFMCPVTDTAATVS
jgi:hypothetical protein